MKSFINVGTIGALGRENDPVITPFGLNKVCIKSLCGMWKYVASLLIVLFVGVGNAWGWSGIRLRGDWAGGFSYTSDTWTYGGEGQKYWDVYHPGGDKYWRIHLDYFNHDAGPNTSNFQQNVGTAGYQVYNNGSNAFKTTANAGILRICSNQITGTDERPYVWVERPAVKFKHNWNGGDWTEVYATDNNNGTYTYRGQYGGTAYFNGEPVNGSWKVAKTSTTVNGSPTTGDRCEFKWTPSGYLYTGGEEDNRGVFVITKLCTITYNGNGKTGGSVPGDQEELYNSTVTLAKNSGNLTKTNHVFTGWNTASNGLGIHYSAGATITVTAGLTLYAEWTEADWGIKGGNSESGDGADEMGDWDTFNPLIKIATNSYRGTIDLAANKVYYFKVTNNTKWNGKDNFAFVGQTHSAALGDNSGGNIKLATGKAGTYTFDYNSSTRELTVTFPNGTAHPSTNFVYFSNPDSWITVLGYVYTSSGTDLVGWDHSPILSSVSIGGKTYYYMALGSHTKGIFRGEKPAGTWSNQTIDLNNASSNYGKYYSNANPESWNPFSVRITLDNQGATSAGTTYRDVNFNSDALTTNITCPSKTGYNFGGYYTEEDGDGEMIINNSGVWQASVAGYTDASKRWIKDGGVATLYAKWTEKTWTVVTEVSPAGTGYANPSSETTFGEVTGGAINASNNTGYHFSTWTIVSGSGSFTSAKTTASNTFKPTSATTLRAVFAADQLTLATEGNWSDAANWTPNCVPTIEHDVVIEKPVIVDVQDARAKSVVLDQHSGNTGKITINAGQELVIAGTLRKTTDGSNRLATAAEDVVINSSSGAGLGALVMGSHDGTNQATVYFYSKSGNDGENWVNQYIGTPFGNEPTAVSQFYNSWLYKIKLEDTGDDIGWFEVDPYEGLISFKGYNLISNSSVGRTYEMQGSLVASTDKNCLLYHSPGTGPTNPNNETLLANSWMAPIKIAAFAAGDFTGAEATIYIFNAGSLDDYNKEPDPAPLPEGNDPGQYSTYSIGTAGNAVIPAMQSFSVFTSDGSHTEGSLFLDYSKLVYDPAVAGTTPAPNRSPRRAKAETSEREEMLLCVRGANGPADRVRILAHEDFDEGFENGWDGHKIFGESFTPQLYAMTTDGNMAVNCIPEYEGTVLGFKPSDVDNSYTFYFRYDGDETLYLNDLKAEQSTLIQDENTYPFTSSVEDAEARFVISATPIPHTPTGIQSVQSDGEQGSKARKLFINGAIYIIRSGRMYDVLGKTMRNEK